MGGPMGLPGLPMVASLNLDMASSNSAIRGQYPAEHEVWRMQKGSRPSNLPAAAVCSEITNMDPIG